MNEQNDQPDQLELVRDVLDKQLVGHDHDPLGRADGIVIVIDDREPKQPPRVTTIQSGNTVLARRIHPRLGDWVQQIGRRCGLRRGVPLRVPWSRVRSVGIEVELDIDAQRSPALRWEQWLSRHVVGRMPSIKPEKKQKEQKEQ